LIRPDTVLVGMMARIRSEEAASGFTKMRVINVLVGGVAFTAVIYKRNLLGTRPADWMNGLDLTVRALQPKKRRLDAAAAKSGAARDTAAVAVAAGLYAAAPAAGRKVQHKHNAKEVTYGICGRRG
jgi:hypothetical protein